MDIEEIFLKLVTHILEGTMLHEQLVNYFDFLALKGFKHCHSYHYIEEIKTYREIQEYYISHYNRLLPKPRINATSIYPASWLSHVRQEVDETTRSEGIRNGLVQWRDWEYETRQLYQNLYGALLSIGEIAAAEKVMELVADVDKELAEAEEMFLEALAVNFDLTVIIPDQNEKYKLYNKKLKKFTFDV